MPDFPIDDCDEEGHQEHSNEKCYTCLEEDHGRILRRLRDLDEEAYSLLENIERDVCVFCNVYLWGNMDEALFIHDVECPARSMRWALQGKEDTGEVKSEPEPEVVHRPCYCKHCDPPPEDHSKHICNVGMPGGGSSCCFKKKNGKICCEVEIPCEKHK